MRSVDWRSVIKDGYCFGRAATGHFLLTQLGIPAKLVFGGLVYRAGPDPSRDLLCYCDGYGYGCMIKGKIFAHQWIQSNNDLVDFSVGDWREDGARPINAVEAEVSAGLGHQSCLTSSGHLFISSLKPGTLNLVRSGIHSSGAFLLT